MNSYRAVVLLSATLTLLVFHTTAAAFHPSGFSIEPLAGTVTVTSYSGTIETLVEEGSALGLDACFAERDGTSLALNFRAPAFTRGALVRAFADGFDDTVLSCKRPPEPAEAAGSVFDGAQVVSFYGYPGIPVMGILGETSARDAAIDVALWADRYAALSSRDTVIPALHLITGVAQRYPGSGGVYLHRLRDEVIEEYVTATADMGQLLFLDTQIGWSDPLSEAGRLEHWLREPHVHLALDPEFATRSRGATPGQAIGTITGDQINEVQAFLANLALPDDAPHKILIVHQFRDDMISTPETIRAYDRVDLVVDMDGFGPRATKLWGYERFALSDYAQYAGFKLFFGWDTPLMSPEEIQEMARPPDLVIYQ